MRAEVLQNRIKKKSSEWIGAILVAAGRRGQAFFAKFFKKNFRAVFLR